MIHLFNRRLLYVGYSQDCKNDILKILDENHIPYNIKTWNVRHADARGRGTFGQLKQYEITYEIYVSRTDFEMSEKLARPILASYTST